VGAFDEAAPPRIEVLAEAVETLRGMNREEDLDLVYVGGIRSGADVARALSLGATAAILGTAAKIAVEAGLPIPSGETEDRSESPPELLARFIKAVLMETAILARCCGKTDVHNLEPEDLRSLTVETSAATGAPVVGRDHVFRKVLAGI
jgi:glutamate synthase domain-containing protein 2